MLQNHQSNSRRNMDRNTQPDQYRQMGSGIKAHNDNFDSMNAESHRSIPSKRHHRQNSEPIKDTIDRLAQS